MPTIVTYNSVNLFTNQPTPFIGRAKENISYGERWCGAERITLVGQLTGCSFSGLTAAQTYLISGFSKDFQKFVINQDGRDIVECENVSVNSISFPSTNYSKILPYQIELSYYPQNSFSGFYGVVDPSDSWNLQETQDGLIEMTHEISARGIHTLSGFGALDNAKTFVLARTGFANFVAPQFIQKYSASGTLREQRETIDRLSATYSMTETYVSDKFFPCDYGILRYTIENGLNQAGFNTATIQGSFEGGYLDDFNLVKNRSKNHDYYSSLLYSIDSGIKLNPTPLSKQFTEDPYNRKINFNLSYDDNPNYQTNITYTVGIESGQDLISVSIDGEINGRGDLANKWNRVKQSYSTFRPYAIASEEFTNYAGTGSYLDSNSTSESVTYDQYNGTISFNFSYQDKIASQNDNLLSFDYTISTNPPLRKIIQTPLILKTGTQTISKYEITDVGFDNRGVLNIAGTAIPKRSVSGVNSVEAVKTTLRKLFTDNTSGYSDLYLENYSIGQKNNEDVDFNCQWSYAGNGVISGENYSVINSL